MPPIEWSMITSTILTLVLPAFSLAAAVTMIGLAIFRSERIRAVGAVLGFLAGMAIGNFRAELVPFLEFETGWRSLFWATVFVTIAATLIVEIHNYWTKLILRLMSAVLISIWLTPWEVIQQRPWMPCLILDVGLLNWLSLELSGLQKKGRLVSLVTCLIWGGCSLVILILCHSARFADLALLANCAVAGVGSVIYFSKTTSSGIIAGLAFYFPALLLAAALNSYSDVPYISLGMAAAAPALLLLGRWKPVSGWLESRPMAIVCLPLAISLIAVGLAVRAELFAV